MEAPEESTLSFTAPVRVNSLTRTFTLSPTHVAYANTLRRLILTGVESVAFRSDMTPQGTTTDVTIKENTTPMTNEMLAHRIGLLPIYITEPLKWDSEEADKYIFTLSVKGEKDRPRDVFAGDFKIKKRVPTEVEPVDIPTEEFFRPNPITRQTCLIATLYPGDKEKIELVAKATIGTGRENARFMPTSQCSYEYTRDPDPVRQEEMFERWLADAKKISAGSLEKDSDKYKSLEREFNNMEVARCYLQDAKGEPYSFDFTIESAGVLNTEYIVRRACEVGEAMFGRYINLDKSEVPSDITITPCESRIIGFDFLIRGHDHTLGNMLQTYLVENHIDGKGLTKITYAGYKVPHPLRDEMVLRIGVEDGREHTARKALAEAARGCVEIFRQMREAWMRAIGESVERVPVPVASAGPDVPAASAKKAKSIMKRKATTPSAK